MPLCGRDENARPTKQQLVAIKDPYDKNNVKMTHREYFCKKAKESDGPSLYLDDEHAQATEYFLSKGVNPSCLVPCNRSKSVANAITQKTNVSCVVGDILDIASNSPDGFYQIVWYDMMCTDFDVRKVVHASIHAMITLNCRGQETKIKESRLTDAIKAIQGTCVVNHGSYVGCGGVLNMVYAFTVTKKPRRVTTPTHDTVGKEQPENCVPQLQIITDNTEDWMNVPLKIPVCRWTEHGIRVDDTLYRVRNGCLLATVVDVRGDCLRLAYQTTGGRMMLDQLQCEKKLPPVTPALAKGWLF